MIRRCLSSIYKSKINVGIYAVTTKIFSTNLESKFLPQIFIHIFMKSLIKFNFKIILPFVLQLFFHQLYFA